MDAEEFAKDEDVMKGEKFNFAIPYGNRSQLVFPGGNKMLSK